MLWFDPKTHFFFSYYDKVFFFFLFFLCFVLFYFYTKAAFFFLRFFVLCRNFFVVFLVLLSCDSDGNWCLSFCSTHTKQASIWSKVLHKIFLKLWKGALMIFLLWFVELGLNFWLSSLQLPSLFCGQTTDICFSI